MFRVIIRTSLSLSTKECHDVYPEDPDPKSLAAYVRLFHELREKDVDYIASLSKSKDRIDFSRNTLHRIQDKFNTLVCTYCGKPDLVIEDQGMIVNQSRKATLDHVIPVSKGGDRYDIKNVCICCGTCNTKKGTMSVQEFIKRFPGTHTIRGAVFNEVWHKALFENCRVGINQPDCMTINNSKLEQYVCLYDKGNVGSALYDTTNFYIGSYRSRTDYVLIVITKNRHAKTN